DQPLEALAGDVIARRERGCVRPLDAFEAALQGLALLQALRVSVGAYLAFGHWFLAPIRASWWRYDVASGSGPGSWGMDRGPGGCNEHAVFKALYAPDRRQGNC